MARCPRAFRKHLMGIDALIPSSAGGNRCEALHGAYQKYVCAVGQNKVLWRLENSVTGPVTVHFIAFFLCKMSLDPEGEALARQWVKWQVDKMVVILEAVVPSQSLYAEVGMRPKPETASRRTRRYCYECLTWVLSIFIYARHWNKHLDCMHVNAHT